MSNRMTLAVVLIVAGLMASPLFAQDAAAPKAADDGKAVVQSAPSPRGPGMRGPGGPGMRGEDPGFFEKLKEMILGLPDLKPEQKDKVKTIFEEQKQALEDWRKGNEGKGRELMEKMRAAREANDQKAVDATREEMNKAAEGRKAIHENLMAKLKEVLTPEQMAKVTEFSSGTRERIERRQAMAGWQRLDLTGEQKAKIEKILDDADAKIMDVLTPEQREKVKENRDARRERRQERRGDRRDDGAPDDGADAAK